LQLEFGELFSSQSGGALLDSGENTLAAQQLIDNPNLTVSLVTPPRFGTLTLNTDGTFDYQHNGGLVFEDSFEFQVTNEDNVSTRATVSILVEPRFQAASEVIPDPIEIAPRVEPQLPSVADNEVVVQTELQAIDELTSKPAPGQQTGFEESQQSSIVNLQFEKASQKVVNVLERIQVVQHNFVSLDATELETVISSSGMDVVKVDSLNSSSPVSAKFVDALRQVENDLKQADDSKRQQYELVRDAAIGASISTTAGVLAWMLRGGALLSSVLTSTPLWKSLDPVRVYMGTRESDQNEDSEVEEYFSDNN